MLKWHILPAKWGALAVAACALSACAAQLPALSTGALSGLNVAVAAPPLEVYQLIARHASRCWFAPDGRLRDKYIFHARVPSPAEGGNIQIALYNRMSTPKKPWGTKALTIELSGTTSTNLDFRNLNVPQTEEDRIKTEALAWANGRTDCKKAEAITPATPTAAPEKAKNAKKKRK